MSGRVLRALAWAWCALAALGCATAGPPPAARADAADCPPLPAGAEPLTAPGGVVLVGEVHGTAEAPAFFGSLVCHAGRRAGAGGVVVGIEMPRSDQAAVDAFFAASSPETARRELLAAGHFTDRWRDGRDSRAVLELFEDLRRWRAAGLDLQVVAFDVAADGTATVPAAEREAAMAERLAGAIAAEPGATMLAFTGNLHSRTVSGVPWDPGLVLMGSHLEPRFPHLRSVNFASSGGTSWTCVMEAGTGSQTCGERRQGGEDRGAEPFVELWPEPDATGHDGIYYLGAITASPPAVPAPAPRASAPPAAG